MEPQTLQAEVRETSGKGPARQLRMRGLIPAIFYGPGTEPQKLAVSPLDLEKTLTGAYRRNQLIELQFGGEQKLALVREIAIDPASRELRHVDFYAVARDRKVDAIVPFENEGRSVGVQKGGFLRKMYREVPVRAFPQDVPAVIVVDISNLEINDVVRVQDLPLPAGVECTFAPERRVLSIDAKERKMAPEEEEAATPAAGATPAAT
jgi:large subunit ribosomal protein L25